MQKPYRRKDDEKPDPILDLYFAIADLLGHAAAARILAILVAKEDQ